MRISILLVIFTLIVVLSVNIIGFKARIVTSYDNTDTMTKQWQNVYYRFRGDNVEIKSGDEHIVIHGGIVVIK